jgi:hypothetical protein
MLSAVSLSPMVLQLLMILAMPAAAKTVAPPPSSHSGLDAMAPPRHLRRLGRSQSGLDRSGGLLNEGQNLLLGAAGRLVVLDNRADVVGATLGRVSQIAPRGYHMGPTLVGWHGLQRLHQRPREAQGSRLGESHGVDFHQQSLRLSRRPVVPVRGDCLMRQLRRVADSLSHSRDEGPVQSHASG